MNYLANKKYKVIWLNSFKTELSHIYFYLCNNLKQHYSAKNLHTRISKLLSSLSYFPERYPKLSIHKDIRKIVFNKYIILYTVNLNTQEVFILHIFHSSQNYLNLL